MLDEIKYLLSKYVLNALGTLRSRDCNLLLAHQSLGDFGQCGQDLPAEFVKTTVLDNTPIRWFYRAASLESAQWRAGPDPGETGVDVERHRAQPGGGERGAYSGDSFIQKEARPLFDVNTLQHLPDGFAVMTGLGVARMAFSSPLRVERREIPLQRFPVLAKTDPLAEFPAPGRRRRAESG